MLDDLFQARFLEWKLLSVSRGREVYAVVCPDDRPCILKLYRATESGCARAERERAALSACRHPGLPEILALDRIDDRPALLLDRFPGVPLKQWVARRTAPSLEAVLDLAVQWCDMLACVHAAHFIHRDFNPGNILVDAASGRTYLIDFGLAQPLGAMERLAGDRTAVEGTLQYIAPEQTGRMNRGCDARSDLYALGATLYFAWTGRPPFDGTDPLELIHAHMAREPAAPEALRADTPAAFSKLVCKLLSKQPDERYQSARAVRADLTSLQGHLRQGSIPDEFALGVEDALARPRFPRALHGRDEECATLHLAYERASSGRQVSVLIGGTAGMGKSSLVESLRRPVSLESGYLTSGKFDLSGDRPNSAWTTALSSLTEQILVESDTRLASWREVLIAQLGPIARALFELSPDLEYLLDEAPPIPDLEPRATQLRLSLALERFLRTVAAPEHPLVLFLDDIQWMDSGSELLLEHVLGTDPIPGLLWIGAYRTDPQPGDESTTLAARLLRLKARAPELTELELKPLSIESSATLLANALGCSTESVAGLARLVERRTANVPLLIREFIDHLTDRSLLRHETGSGWQWDLERIAHAAIPDGAVALMTAKIERIPAQTREVLSLASCIGDHFVPEFLAQLSELALPVLKQALYELTDAGLIAPAPDGFRFTHDRIREAARSGLPADARARLHAHTGRLLLERTPSSERDERAFDLAYHLNQGAAHLSDALRPDLIDVNTRAGRLALARGAAAEAFGYLSRAREHFSEEDWAARAPDGFELFLLCAESAFLSGTFQQALQLLDDLEHRSPSRMQLADIAVLRIRIYSLLEAPVECVRRLLAALQGLGTRWPLHPTLLRSRLEVWKARWALLRSTREPFLRPAVSRDSPWAARTHLIDGAGGIAARVDGHLLVMISSLILRENLRSGYLTPPGFNLAAFALYAHSVELDSQLISRCLAHAEEWNARVPDPTYGPRTEFQVAITRAWIHPRRESLPPLARLGRALREAGDPEWAYYADFQHATHGALAGREISGILAELEVPTERVRRSGHRYPNFEGFHRAYHLLGVADARALDLDTAVTNAERWAVDNPASTQTILRTLWMLSLSVYRRDDLVFAMSEPIAPRILRVLPLSHIADHMLYRGLAASRLARRSHARRQRRTYERAFGRAHRLVRRFAGYGPDMAHMALMLDAERAALRGRIDVAVQTLATAARAAMQQQFVHNAALAHEKRARYLAARNRETDAERAMGEAIQLYQQWGANAKARSLAEEQRTMIEW